MCNLAPGLVVPMPTLPVSEIIDIISVGVKELSTVAFGVAKKE
jgi:hypothetical protein